MRERRKTVAQVSEQPDTGCIPAAVKEFVSGVVKESSVCVGGLDGDFRWLTRRGSYMRWLCGVAIITPLLR